MSSTSLKDAQRVIEWIKVNSGHFNTDILEIKPSPLGGIGVFAKEDIKLNPDLPPPVLLRLHKDSILSAHKSYISNLLYESKITGALALVIAFIYESELKEKSPWWPFIRSIKYLDDDNDNNSPIVPPSAWSKKEQQLLRGSEIDVQGHLSVQELLDSYEKACLFAGLHNDISNGAVQIPDILNLSSESTANIPEDLKFKHFIAISHALASRNFEIDAFHEVALVPGADLFNHTNDPSVRFESMYEVCEACGAFEGECDHIILTDDEGEGEDGYQDGCCGGEEHEHDHGHEDENQEMGDDDEDNHSGEEEQEVQFKGTIEELIEVIEQEIREAEEESKQADLEESQELESAKKSGVKIELYSPEITDAEGKVIHPNACVDITLTRSVSKGEEVFNTYGELPNVVLLNKYGFVIKGNEFDTVNLGDAFENLKKFRRNLFRVHFKWWEQKGYEQVKRYLRSIDEEEEEEEEGENGNSEGCCSSAAGHNHRHSNENFCDEEQEEVRGHEEDGCCGGKPHDHHNDHEDGEEDEEEDEDTCYSGVDLLSTSEPNAITLALLRLLTLHKTQLIKFTNRGEELIPWLFKPDFKHAHMTRRMQRIWRDVLSFRLQAYEYEDLRNIPQDDLEDVREDRLKFIKSIVGQEFKILERALDKASIM